MQKLIKLSIFIIFILFIQGCSNNSSFSNDELQNLVSNVHYDNLEKVEFNKEKNELDIFILDEFINNIDSSEIIDKIHINNLSGKEAIKSSNFKDKKFNISIISINKNEILIKDNDVENYKLNIINDKYSKEYVKQNLSKLSKSIVSFNNSIGGIEIDLRKNQKNNDRVEEFNRIYNDLLKEIEKLKLLVENSELNVDSELNKNIYSINNLVNSLKNNVEKSLELNSHYAIESNFLSVNDLDRLSREIVK